MRSSLFRFAFLLVIVVTFIRPVNAETVKLPLPGGQLASATWLDGNKDRPAILVMHGFLQTWSFRATSNIIEGLSSQGYAILGPNLSLGVSMRQQSMQCQAPHQHTFEKDIKEMKSWIDWLKGKGFKSFIIVGHSWGSQHGIGFVNRYSDVNIKGLIAISLVRTNVEEAIRSKQIVLAKKRLAKKDSALHKYQLSFCKNYTAVPQSYLSYALWDDKSILKSLGRINKSKIPVYVILGGSDKRIDANWIADVKKNSRFIIVKGANHFFSSVYELELADKLEEVLGQLASRK